MEVDESETIDLDNLQKTHEDIVLEWDLSIRKKFLQFSLEKNGMCWFELMREYLQSLEEIAQLYSETECLRERVCYHLRFLYSRYTEMQYCTSDDYLNIMEDILTIYCNLEMEMMRQLGKKMKKKLIIRAKLATVRTIQILTLYLLERLDHILHVLIKMNTEKLSNFGKLFLNLIYKQFLVRYPVTDLSNESFCRYYILIQKWKEISKENDWEKLDLMFYKMLGRPANTVCENEVLRKILLPICETTQDVVMGLFHSRRVISNSYFKHMKMRKKYDLDCLNFDNLDLEENGNTSFISKEEAEDIELQKVYENLEKKWSKLSQQEKENNSQNMIVQCKIEIEDEVDDVEFIEFTPSVQEYEIADLLKKSLATQIIQRTSPPPIEMPTTSIDTLPDGITQICISDPRTVCETTPEESTEVTPDEAKICVETELDPIESSLNEEVECSQKFCVSNPRTVHESKPDDVSEEHKTDLIIEAEVKDHHEVFIGFPTPPTAPCDQQFDNQQTFADCVLTPPNDNESDDHIIDSERTIENNSDSDDSTTGRDSTIIPPVTAEDDDFETTMFEACSGAVHNRLLTSPDAIKSPRYEDGMDGFESFLPKMQPTPQPVMIPDINKVEKDTTPSKVVVGKIRKLENALMQRSPIVKVIYDKTGTKKKDDVKTGSPPKLTFRLHDIGAPPVIDDCERKLSQLHSDEKALNLTLDDEQNEFSNSPTFLSDDQLRHCLEETATPSCIDDTNSQNINFLSHNSNFYKTDDESILKLPTAVPHSYDFEKNVKNEVFSKIDLNSSFDDPEGEVKLPLKKRKVSVITQLEEISYPATPMISIAEVEELNPRKRAIKTAAERKEMPVQSSSHLFFNDDTIKQKNPVISTEHYNINNHTYNNPTINYHMNNVPVPFFNLSCGSYYSLSPLLLPLNNLTNYNESNPVTSTKKKEVKKHPTRQRRKK